jgi:ketosteroid isomerase-like protein
MLSRMTDRVRVSGWVDRYERAWRAPGTAALRELFTDDATYQLAPYDAPIRGIDEIARMWEREREGPDEAFTMRSEIVAVEDDVAVVRVEVRYGPPEREYRDLWVLRLSDDGRCSAFEEWPFWPQRERVSPQAPGT